MQEAVLRMLDRYTINTADEGVRALREILQECALLGLWRAKFFEHAAFYGGSALRIVHGLDRFSEDLDFTLLKTNNDFDLGRFTTSLQQELRTLGFDVQIDLRRKAVLPPVQSAFLKANTRALLVVIRMRSEMVAHIPTNQTLKIKLEIDSDPPLGFATEPGYLLLPIPFAVRICTLPDLFAGKMHAVLFRRWINRVKGRDWYDFVWFVGHHPELHLSHLEQRMRQTKHWAGETPLSQESFLKLLGGAIDRLDVDQARREVKPFLKNLETVHIWSREFFHEIGNRIRFT